MQKWTLKHGGRSYGPMSWAEMRVVIKLIFGGAECAHTLANARTLNRRVAGRNIAR